MEENRDHNEVPEHRSIQPTTKQRRAEKTLSPEILPLRIGY
jgi:hypothetical protein